MKYFILLFTCNNMLSKLNFLMYVYVQKNNVTKVIGRHYDVWFTSNPSFYLYRENNKNYKKPLLNLHLNYVDEEVNT
jgi:hypothetical protein